METGPTIKTNQPVLKVIGFGGVKLLFRFVFKSQVTGSPLVQGTMGEIMHAQGQWGHAEIVLDPLLFLDDKRGQG